MGKSIKVYINWQILANLFTASFVVDDDGQAKHNAIQDGSSNSDLEDSPLDVLLETMETMDGKCRVIQLHITVLAVFIFKELTKRMKVVMINKMIPGMH